MSKSDAQEWGDTLNAALETILYKGFVVSLAGVDIPLGTKFEVRSAVPKSEVELLRERIAELEARLGNQSAELAAVDTYGPQPEVTPDITPSKALMSADTLRDLNDKYAIGLKYDIDFDLFRVYANREYAGAANTSEVDKLVLSVKLEPGQNIAGKTYTFGRGFMRQYAENAAKPKPKRRQYPVQQIHVPNLYVERDPQANGGTAYSLS